MASPLRIILADDHHILLDGLRSLLKRQKDMAVVGAFTDGNKLLAALPELGAVDLALLDLSMPEMDGAALTREIRNIQPDIKIIILSMHDDAGNIMRMIDLGVNGYLLKNAGDQELLAAIHKVAAGRYYFSEEVAQTIAAAQEQCRAQKEEPQQPRLSGRELEILKLIAAEMSNADIAQTLFISERTVETHRKNMLRKMNHKSMVGLLRYALEQKLI